MKDDIKSFVNNQTNGIEDNKDPFIIGDSLILIANMVDLKDFEVEG